MRYSREDRCNTHFRYSSQFRHKRYDLPPHKQRSSPFGGTVEELAFGTDNRYKPQGLTVALQPWEKWEGGEGQAARLPSLAHSFDAAGSLTAVHHPPFAALRIKKTSCPGRSTVTAGKVCATRTADANDKADTTERVLPHYATRTRGTCHVLCGRSVCQVLADGAAAAFESETCV